jgi:hypothetical protein
LELARKKDGKIKYQALVEKLYFWMNQAIHFVDPKAIPGLLPATQPGSGEASSFSPKGGVNPDARQSSVCPR